MKKKALYLSFALVAMLSLSFGTILATTLFIPIRASINRSYVYKLDNKVIMSTKPALLYNGVIYAPVDAVASSLGFKATIAEDRTTFTKKTNTSSNTVTINRAMVSAIDFASNTLTVYPEGQSSNQIRLLITPQTVITYANTGQRASITSLGTATVVKVVRTPQTTKTTPPQATALSIQILSPMPPQPR